MGEAKATFNQTVNMKAKDGFKRAGQVVFGDDRAMTKVFNAIGEDLSDQIGQIVGKNGKMPKCRIEVRLIPEK